MDKEYHLELNGTQLSVTKEVYYAFKRPAWQERKRRQIRSEIELSYEVFADAGFDIPSEEALVEEIVEDKLLTDMLLKALSELTEDERFFINELFYKRKSERAIAKEIGVSQNTVHYHKNRLLEKLQKLMEKKI